MKTAPNVARATRARECAVTLPPPTTRCPAADPSTSEPREG
jgi:hypothetical protein